MKSKKKSIALYGGSFNPPGEHHRAIARHLAKHFDEVVVVPCGPRPDKPITNQIAPIYRAAMIDLAFRGIPKVRVDLFDLESSAFTRTHELDTLFSAQGEVWHVVGADLIEGGAQKKSFIQREWERGTALWKEGRFAVVHRPGVQLNSKDLPPHHRVFELDIEGSSSWIRERVFHRKPLEGLVSPEVERFLERYHLYRGLPPSTVTNFRLEDLRCKIVVDDRNPQAVAMARVFPPSVEKDPNLILVIGGDGVMLRAIRKYWRLRTPFYGINAGHMGFLLNKKNVPSLEKRSLVLHHLPLLWVETTDTKGERKQGFAFNDAWVERATGQTAKIKVDVNGEERLPELMADGALLSTAAGSASYARAMGAPPLPFNTPVLLLVGSNVLKPNHWRSAVLPLEACVEFQGLDPDKRPLNGYIDGLPQGEVSKMSVRVSHTASVELVFEPGYDPAEKLARIQFPQIK